MTAARDSAAPWSPPARAASSTPWPPLQRADGRLTAAEAEPRAAYSAHPRAGRGARRPRPYTAGHSERVSQTSVVSRGSSSCPSRSRHHPPRRAAARHRQIGLGRRHPAEGRTLSATGTADQTPPGTRARILRQVSFLEPHLPIVELPRASRRARLSFGLRGVTSDGRADRPRGRRLRRDDHARAYRPARPAGGGDGRAEPVCRPQSDATVWWALPRRCGRHPPTPAGFTMCKLTRCSPFPPRPRLGFPPSCGRAAAAQRPSMPSWLTIDTSADVDRPYTPRLHGNPPFSPLRRGTPGPGARDCRAPMDAAHPARVEPAVLAGRRALRAQRRRGNSRREAV